MNLEDGEVVPRRVSRLSSSSLEISGLNVCPHPFYQVGMHTSGGID